MENKYKVGDLITDETNLCKIVSIGDETCKLKIITGPKQGEVLPAKNEVVNVICFLYDINNPCMETVNAGVCHCKGCAKKLALGDSCIRYNDDVFCNEDCLLDYLSAEDSNVNEDDLDDSKTKTVPLFELTKDQLDLINDNNQTGEGGK